MRFRRRPSEADIYDKGDPAAVAAHDQVVCQAREMLRTCQRFVVVGVTADGHTVMGGSADLPTLMIAERIIHESAVRVLEAEYDSYLEGEE